MINRSIKKRNRVGLIIKGTRREIWFALLFFVVLIVIWEIVMDFQWINSPFLPSPSRIIKSAGEMISKGDLQSNLGITLARMLIGFAIGTTAGLFLGLAMGWSKTLRLLLDPIISAIYPIPKIAILPLIMLLIGIGEQTIILVVALSAFFPVLINCTAGVININPLYFDLAKNYGADRRQIFTKVMFPGSLPMTLAGIRLALGMSLLMVIVVELALANKGLGAMLWLSWSTLHIERIYVTIIIIALLSLIYSPLLKLITMRLAPWQDEKHN